MDEFDVHDANPGGRGSVRFGGLRGRIRYDDDAFAWPDPEIERMFYGDDSSDDAARPSVPRPRS